MEWKKDSKLILLNSFISLIQKKIEEEEKEVKLPNKGMVFLFSPLKLSNKVMVFSFTLLKLINNEMEWKLLNNFFFHYISFSHPKRSGNWYQIETSFK